MTHELLRPRWVAGHLLALFMTALFVLLGTWQLSRHHDKQEEVRARAAAFAAPAPFAKDKSLGEALLTPTRLYVMSALAAIRGGGVHGLAHITGGGITDNLPRVLPTGTAARVDRTSWRVPPLFRWLGESGRVPEYDLRRALNMGIGLILVVAANDADAVRATLLNAGEANSIVIGDIIAGDQDVQYV